MKLISIILIICFLTGCTTFKPVESAPDMLQEQISSKEIIKPVKQVKIVTTDGKHHKFKVVDVTDAYIEGNNVKVPIADIVSIETQEPAVFSSALIVLGVLAVVVFGAAMSQLSRSNLQ